MHRAELCRGLAARGNRAGPPGVPAERRGRVTFPGRASSNPTEGNVSHDDPHDELAPTLTRRTLLKTSLPVIVGAGMGFGCGGATLPTATVSAGSVDDLPLGQPTQLTGYDVFVVRGEQGVAAISGRCPHQGCGVEPADDGGFRCPCHGSTFSADGTVENGPASEDLVWYAVELEGGEVMVDASRTVPQGTYTPL